MNLAHLHLLLNHFPTIGTIFGLSVLVLALMRRSDHLRQVGYEVFFLLALVSLPVYMSGNAALDIISGRPNVSDSAVTAHQNAALLALVFMEITGLVAWYGLWRFQRLSRTSGVVVSAVLVLAVVTLGLMASAATIGGEIIHEEIRADQSVSAEAAPPPTLGLSTAAVASFVGDNTWVWPASETLHFIGLCLLFGIVLLVNLRMLGMMKGVSFASMHGLLPWAVAGFGLNAITGMMFFIAAPGQYTENPAFYWKMALMLIAGVNALYLTMVDEAWAVGPGDDAPIRAKVVAASAICLWVGVIYAGRMLPFLGNAF